MAQMPPFRAKNPMQQGSKPPMMGGKPPMMGGKAPFGGKPKMMAGGGFGAPSPIGGPPPAAAAAPPPPPAAGLMDPDQDGDMDSSPGIRPESLNYHDDAQSCQMCQYMGEGGNCAVLKMQVSPEGACNAFEGKGDQGQGEQMPDDSGGSDEGMYDMGAGQ